MVLYHMAQNHINIKPISTRKDLNAFIGMPNRIYQEDPHWVARLRLERQQHFTAANPFFEHGKWQGWLAFKDRRLAGRISAQIDYLHEERYRNATGYFGSLEGENDLLIFRALFDTAETWLRQQGMKRVVGPLNLNINQEVGLLIRGFDRPPFFMMGHAHPYFAAHIQQCGYQKAVDTLAFRIVLSEFCVPPAMRAYLERMQDKLHLRPIDKKRAASELNLVRDIFNDAWDENWGFVPFTESEFLSVGTDMLKIISPDYIHIAEFEGEPAAFIVLLPNVNEMIQDLQGRLLPFGWLKLLWRLKIGRPKTARVPLMGVRKKYQNSMIGAALAFCLIQKMHDKSMRNGVQEIELSWVLEHNTRMKKMLETISAKVYKTYRIYEKSLSQDDQSQ